MSTIEPSKPPRKAYIEAYACGSYGDGPRWAEIEITEQFVARLRELQELCEKHGLSEVRQSTAPEWGPGDVADELRLDNDELVVCRNLFWFVANPKHADYNVQSRSVSNSELQRAIASTNGPIFLGSDPDALREAVMDASAQEPNDHGDDCEAPRG